MPGLDARVQVGVLDLDKVADMHPRLQHRAGAQTGKGADVAAARHPRPLHHTVGVNQASGFQGAVLDHAVGADHDALTQHRLAQQVNPRPDHAVWPDHDLVMNERGGRVLKRDARTHVGLVHAPPHDGLQLRELHAVIGPHHLAGVGDLEGRHPRPALLVERHQIGDVILARRVVISDPLSQHRGGGVHHVHAAVELAHRLLGRGRGFLLDDTQHLAALTAQDAPIAACIGQFAGQHGQGVVARTVGAEQVLQGRQGQHRGVAVEQQHVGPAPQPVGRRQESVAGAELLVLTGKLHPRRVQRLLNLLSAVPGDHHDVAGTELLGQPHAPQHQRAAQKRVEHLGQPGLHAGSLARRQNHHVKRALFG